MLSERVGRTFEGGDGLALAMAVAGLLLLGPGIADAGAELLDPALLAAGLGVAMLSSVIPYSLELEALRRLPRGIFGVLMSLEPAVAATAGLIILDQGLAREGGDGDRARRHRQRRRPEQPAAAARGLNGGATRLDVQGRSRNSSARENASPGCGPPSIA